MTDKKKRTSGWSILVLGSKLAKVFKGLSTAAKSLKALGPLMTLGTMTLSIWAYSYSLGWPLAAMLVLLLFVHEMGHVIACRYRGFKVKAPLFIPFIGALIFAPSNMSREDESYIGYGGPFLGSIGAVLVWLASLIIPSHQDLLLMSAYFGVILNLFNLLPISPLDGGRILQSVGTWVRWVGLSLLMIITLFLQDVGWLFIWIIVLSDFRIRHRAPIMIVVWVLMVIGYAVDFGLHTHWGVKAFHIFLGALFTAITWIFDFADVNVPVRPPQPKNRARTWLFLYLIMTALLTMSLIVISHQIHPIIEKNKQEQVGAVSSDKTIQ